MVGNHWHLRLTDRIATSLPVGLLWPWSWWKLHVHHENLLPNTGKKAAVRCQTNFNSNNIEGWKQDESDDPTKFKDENKMKMMKNNLCMPALLRPKKKHTIESWIRLGQHVQNYPHKLSAICPKQKQMLSSRSCPNLELSSRSTTSHILLLKKLLTYGSFKQATSTNSWWQNMSDLHFLAPKLYNKTTITWIIWREHSHRLNGFKTLNRATLATTPSKWTKRRAAIFQSRLGLDRPSYFKLFMQAWSD